MVATKLLPTHCENLTMMFYFIFYIRCRAFNDNFFCIQNVHTALITRARERRVKLYQDALVYMY